ncbi:ATP-binding cassette domain-containing protein [Sphingomonas sp. LR61]
MSLQGISKRFGAVQALSGIDFDVHAGEVVALVGDNGAGKSTFVKILAGVYTPDEGTITFEGEPVHIGSPAAAQALGIATVFQDLALADNLDVVSNLFLGREVSHFVLDEEEMERKSWSCSDSLGSDPVRPHPHRVALRRSAADRRDRPVVDRRPEDRHPRRADRRARRRADRRGPEPRRTPPRPRPRRRADQPQPRRRPSRRRPRRSAPPRPQQR